MAQATIASAEPSAIPAPLGGRSSLMGGTGVALGQDGSVPFLNPAAMGRIADVRLAFSVKLFRLTRASYHSLAEPPRGWGDGLPRVKLRRNRVQGIPSTFCAFFTLKGLLPEDADGLMGIVRGSSGRTKLGFCGANIERSNIDVPAVGGQRRIEGRSTAFEMGMRHEWRRFALGPSLSYQLSDEFTVGISMHGVWTNVSTDWSVNAIRLSEEGEQLATLSRAGRGRSIDGQTTYGLLYSSGRQFFGLSFRVPAIHFEGHGVANRTDHNPDGSATVALLDGEFVAKPAPVIRLGTGRETASTRLEFDTAYHFGSRAAIETRLREDTFGGGIESFRRRQLLKTRDTVSFSLGGERQISKRLSLLGGLELAPSMMRELPKNDPLIVSTRTNRVAWSFGLGSYGAASELLVGARVAYEWGTLAAPRFNGSELAVAERRAWEALLILSGAVSLKSLQRTVDGLRELPAEFE